MEELPACESSQSNDAGGHRSISFQWELPDARAGLESFPMEEQANRYGTGGRRSDGRIRSRVNRPSRTTPAVIVPSASRGNFQTLAPVWNRSRWKNSRRRYTHFLKKPKNQKTGDVCIISGTGWRLSSSLRIAKRQAPSASRVASSRKDDKRDGSIMNRPGTASDGRTGESVRNRR